MSRQSMMPPRNLTLTEELERLEQSITLTLQEIDHNFSRAHRIVTSSIIPIVEQYAKHSDAVWDGSKFWKQFFEASANVSLSSYEEPQEDDTTVTGQEEEDEDDLDLDVSLDDQGGADDTVTAANEQSSSRFDEDIEASSILDSPSVTVRYQSTPRHRQQDNTAPRSQPKQASSRQAYKSPSPRKRTGKLPITPGRSTQGSYEDSSPAPAPPSTTKQLGARRHDDPLLHRVLDKSYRIQATPHSSRKAATYSSRIPPAAAAAPAHSQTSAQTTTRAFALDSSPFSPALAAPQLRSDLFGTPRGPRTPGVSIQHSARQSRKRTPGLASARKTLFPQAGAQQQQQQSSSQATSTARSGPAVAEDLWSSDEDEEDLFPQDMSPPKTMHFHVPQSRLVQTPARDASKRIVEELLRSAGVPQSVTSEMGDLDLGGGGGMGEGQRRWGDEEEDEDEGIVDPGSPSIVRGLSREDEEDF